MNKVGLVLSGGGAKGAYQVGVLKALRKLGTEVHVVSGASIGALNAGVLASADNFAAGVEHIEEIWLELARNSPLEVNKSVYPKLLLLAGATLHPMAGRLLAALPTIRRKFFPGSDWLDMAVLSNKPLSKLLDKYLSLDKLSDGLPLYVSVFRSKGGIVDIAEIMSAELGLKDNPQSEYVHIQSLPRELQKKMLMASAAIPLMFSEQVINGVVYTDGGQGGWSKQHGNTPIKPLIDAGCNLVIVTHLNDGSLWSRHDFPDTTIVEIRPQALLGRDQGTLGAVKDILGFTTDNIQSWIDQGYADTMISMGRIIEVTNSRYDLKMAREGLEKQLKNSVTSDKKLAEAMNQLREVRDLKQSE